MLYGGAHVYFQFLNGAIVRKAIQGRTGNADLFQFLNGAIVRTPAYRLSVAGDMFQFLNGAIVRYTTPVIIEGVNGFNS